MCCRRSLRSRRGSPPGSRSALQTATKSPRRRICTSASLGGVLAQRIDRSQSPARRSEHRVRSDHLEANTRVGCAPERDVVKSSPPPFQWITKHTISCGCCLENPGPVLAVLSCCSTGRAGARPAKRPSILTSSERRGEQLGRAIAVHQGGIYIPGRQTDCPGRGAAGRVPNSHLRASMSCASLTRSSHRSASHGQPDFAPGGSRTSQRGSRNRLIVSPLGTASL